MQKTAFWLLRLEIVELTVGWSTNRCGYREQYICREGFIGGSKMYSMLITATIDNSIANTFDIALICYTHLLFYPFNRFCLSTINGRFEQLNNSRGIYFMENAALSLLILRLSEYQILLRWTLTRRGLRRERNKEKKVEQLCKTRKQRRKMLINKLQTVSIYEVCKMHNCSIIINYKLQASSCIVQSMI